MYIQIFGKDIGLVWLMIYLSCLAQASLYRVGFLLPGFRPYLIGSGSQPNTPILPGKEKIWCVGMMDSRYIHMV